MDRTGLLAHTVCFCISCGEGGDSRGYPPPPAPQTCEISHMYVNFPIWWVCVGGYYKIQRIIDTMRFHLKEQSWARDNSVATM